MATLYDELGTMYPFITLQGDTGPGQQSSSTLTVYLKNNNEKE